MNRYIFNTLALAALLAGLACQPPTGTHTFAITGFGAVGDSLTLHTRGVPEGHRAASQ